MAEQKPAATAVQKFQEGTVEQVLKRVDNLKESGGLSFPPNYSVHNALRSAWLMLQEVKDKTGTSVLTVCTKESIANSLFNMAISGLNPAKKQCAFMARGNKLTMQRMYSGSLALARRFGDLKEVNATVIYEGDEFEYEIIPETGRRRVVKHTQKMQNIDETRIKGCYAVGVFNDRTTDMLPMTIAQIRTSWSQGELGGKGPAHVRFASAMCRKTLINAFCKIIIDSSDDSALITEDDDGTETPDMPILHESNAGKVVDIPEEEPMREAEVVEEPELEPQTEQQPTEPVPQQPPAPEQSSKPVQPTPGQAKAPF